MIIRSKATREFWRPSHSSYVVDGRDSFPVDIGIQQFRSKQGQMTFCSALFFHCNGCFPFPEVTWWNRTYVSLWLTQRGAISMRLCMTAVQCIKIIVPTIFNSLYSPQQMLWISVHWICYFMQNRKMYQLISHTSKSHGITQIFLSIVECHSSPTSSIIYWNIDQCFVLLGGGHNNWCAQTIPCFFQLFHLSFSPVISHRGRIILYTFKTLKAHPQSTV